MAWLPPLAPAAQTPHPAVVRVIAAEPNGASLGTGALVAVDEAHGLVVTNWHVVRDATGPITVVFPAMAFAVGPYC
jgi:S1-C subfamily serine protease